MTVPCKAKPKRPRPRALVPFAYASGPGWVALTMPVMLVSEANAHADWRVRHRRVKKQRGAVARLAGMFLRRGRVTVPCKVTITRIAPYSLDSDNLVGSGKGVRDAVAELLGVDDRCPQVTWTVEQRRGAVREYGVEVRVEWEAQS